MPPTPPMPFTQLSGTEFGVDFDDVSDRLRVVSDTGQNLRVDVDSGAVITDTALSRTGVNGAAYTNAFAAACRSTAVLHRLDHRRAAHHHGSKRRCAHAWSARSASTPPRPATSRSRPTPPATRAMPCWWSAAPPLRTRSTSQTGTAATAGPVTRLDDGEVVRDTAIAPPATAPNQDPGDLYAVTESGNAWCRSAPRHRRRSARRCSSPVSSPARPS